ncbi:class I SAM-dependent methyltransferase [Thermodesulfobacteriota bacterium]
MLSKKIQSEANFYNSIRPVGNNWEDNLFYARFIKLYGFAVAVAEKFSSSKGIALDAATGMGYGAKVLNTYFENVYGIDICDEALNHAKAKYNGPIFKKGNVLDLSFDDNSFEAVFSIETLEHLHREDLNGYINELIRVTKSGGIIFISTPNKPVYSSLHTVKDHHCELDILELKSLIENSVKADVEYYQFGGNVGKNLRRLNSIEKHSLVARKIFGRMFGMPYPRNLTLIKAIEFWDISIIKNGNNSLGYLNIAVISKLRKDEGNDEK